MLPASHLDRAHVYRFLARTFQYPEKSLLDRIRDEDLPDLGEALGRLGGDAEIVALCKRLSDCIIDTKASALKHSYMKTFDPSGGAERLNQLVSDFAESHGLPSELVFRLTLVLEEIITNVISYGYEDEMEHEISVRLSWEDPDMKIEVEDDGRPFNPLEAPPPDMVKPLAEKPVAGLGIHLVREMTDKLEYRRENDKNLLVLKTRVRET